MAGVRGGLMGALLLAACGGTSASTPDAALLPDPSLGPPRLLAAFVLAAPPDCDLADPRSWGGDSSDHPRCVPDLLDPNDAAKTYPASAELRLIFNEQLDRSRIEVVTSQSFLQLNPDIWTATAAGMSVSTAVNLSLYDSWGRDFRQGLPGTAPPGPAIEGVFGDGQSRCGVPAGSTLELCLVPSEILDLDGNPPAAGSARCVAMNTQPVQGRLVMPAEGASIPASQAGFVELEFNAPLLASSILPSSLEVRVADETTVLPSSCESFQVESYCFLAPPDGHSLLLTLAPSCLPLPAGGVRVTVHAGVTDQYGVPLGADLVGRFTVTP